MSRRRNLVHEQANALVFLEKIDIHRCQFCQESLRVRTDTAQNDDRDITVYCPNCEVSVGGECLAAEVATFIDHLCEAHAQMAKQAKANRRILSMPRGDLWSQKASYPCKNRQK